MSLEEQQRLAVTVRGLKMVVARQQAIIKVLVNYIVSPPEKEAELLLSQLGSLMGGLLNGSQGEGKKAQESPSENTCPPEEE